MKKKLILLVMLLITALASTAYAQKTTDEKTEVLTNLGIINDEFAGQKIITTQDYISAVVNMMTDEGAADSDSYKQAKNLGIVGGISEQKLSGAVTNEQAYKIALRALGYGKIMEKSGEDVSTLTALASDAGLLKGVDMKEPNGTNIVKLLYNLSEATMIEMTSSSGTYKLDGSGKTLLEFYRGIEVIEGQVTATNCTSLIKEEGVPNNRIEINNGIYYVEKEYSPEILGASVEAYLKSDEDKLLYVAPLSSKREMMEIKADDIENVDSRYEYIEYTEPDTTRIKKVKLSPTVKVIYNGKLYSDYTAEDLKPDKGKLVFSDVDKDDKYDLVFVYSYRTIIADQVSSVKKSITNKYTYDGAEPTLTIDTGDIVTILATDGSVMKFSDIKQGYVLNVAMSKGENKRLITILVSTEKISGTVTMLNTADGFLKTEEAEYDISYVYTDAVEKGERNISEITVGNPTVLYLDSDGEVAYAKNDRLNGFVYLYILKLIDFEQDEYGVKALNLDGEWKNYKFAQKTKINSLSGSVSPEKIYNELERKIPNPELVMAKINKNGEITELKLPFSTDETDINSFTKTPQRTVTYFNFDGATAPTLGFKEYVTTDTPVILTPSDSADMYNEKAYDAGGIGLLSHWKDCTYSAYNKDENNVADIVVAKNQNTGGETYFMVNSVATGINDEDERVKVFEGELTDIGGVTLYEYEPDSVSIRINKGDILKVLLKDGKIKSAEKYFSLADGVTYQAPSGDFAGNQDIKGKVKAVDASLGLITVECSADGSKVYTLNRHSRECVYTMYNRDTQKYEKASFNEIEPGDAVLMRTFSATIRWCIIIKPE